MIEFVTLLLGLLIGPQDVELSADSQVASIRMILDGETVATLEDGPPWRATIDLGDDLRPRRLEAVAFDSEQRPVGRARQILNYLRPSHDIGITLETQKDDGSRAGRLVWRAVLDQAPTRVDLRFDGRPIAIERDGSFVLPPHDLSEPHAVEAVAVFPDGQESRSEMAFGGLLGEEVTSALSPLALRSRKGRSWSVEKLAGKIEREGDPLGIFATHSAPRRVVLLRDTAAHRAMRYYAAQLENMGQHLPWRGEMSDTYVSLGSPVPIPGHPEAFPVNDVPITLVEREALRRALTSQYIVHPADDDEDARERQRLWSALAIVGKRAAASRGPRAVLLMVDEGLDPRAPGPEQLSLSASLDYLASLRVPVFVWGVSKEALEPLGLDDSVRVYRDLPGLMRVMQDLDAELDSQTLVWVEGDHLPDEVELARGVDWVR